MPKDLHLSDFFCTFATPKVIRTTKSNNMEATLSYNPRNHIAQATMAYIQSLGVFTITPVYPKSSVKKKAKDSADEQLWGDLRGALQEVKNHHDGKKQMKGAYELLNEL